MTKAVVPNFEWRDRHGGFHKVSDMATSHLFYTVRMVWNHSAPLALQLTPFHRYKFSQFYTGEYIMQAVRAIMVELGTRKDIKPFMQADLKFMADNYDHWSRKDVKDESTNEDSGKDLLTHME